MGNPKNPPQHGRRDMLKNPLARKIVRREKILSRNFLPEENSLHNIGRGGIMEKLSWIFSRERNISPFLCRGIGEGVWRKIPIPLLVVEKSSDGKINLRYFFGELEKSSTIRSEGQDVVGSRHRVLSNRISNIDTAPTFSITKAGAVFFFGVGK